MTLNHNCGCFNEAVTGIAGNGSQVYLVVDLEIQNFKFI